MIDEREIKEVYTEDTIGRKYHKPILTAKNGFINYKEAQKQHGEVQSFNLNKLLTKKEFLKLTDDLKKMYITNLKEKYNATYTEIAFSMGWDNSSLGKLLKNIGMPRGYNTGKKNAEQTIGWQEFLKQKEENTPKIETIKEATEKKEFVSSVCNLHFEQVGEMNAELIAKRISALIPDGIKCKVAITIETAEV